MEMPMLTRRQILAAPLALAAPALIRPAGAAEGVLKVRDLYARDRSLSELGEELVGQRIAVEGYMAPPLRAEASFFVLTKMPMSVCPFCETEAEWPDDILAVYTKRVVRPVYWTVGIEARGVLDIGPLRDEETGFLSMVRLMDATYER
jgi:hypothetical protein